MMKKVSAVIKKSHAALVIGAVCASMLVGYSASGQSIPVKDRYVYRGSGNPYLPLWEHLPDGEPRVFEDPDNPGKFRAYIIGSHDVRTRSYCGPDIRQWSAPVEDLSSWRDEGPIFTYKRNNQWDTMYAPDLVEVKGKDGKKVYYLYPHNTSMNQMVAKGDRPDGPFTVINVGDNGRPLPGSMIGFDPGVLIDYITDQNDPAFDIGFRAYAYWGFQTSNAGELDQKTMYSLKPGTQAIPSFHTRIFPGENQNSFAFFEAASIRKVGNKYVWIYSGYSGQEYGVGRSNSTLRYAFGDSALGPWRSGGVLVDSRSVVLNQDGTRLQTTFPGHNTHGSLQLINDQYYVFYHRPPRGNGNARQSMVAPVKVTWDEKSVADGGKVTIVGYDPYATDNVWTAKASGGNHYTGAEVTSEGFHIFGLDPYKYYSAGYACYMSNANTMQDTYDNWDNNMPLVNVTNGNVIGYKYFGFGGLDKAQKGLLPFEGAKPGNKTEFNLFLAPKTDAAFKVNVWMDGPWDNATWKGKKLGEINVPANAAKEMTKFTLDVAAAVESIGGKHAIFLVTEGPGGPLCDIAGLGFSSSAKPIVRPIPPKVSILVNGQAVTLPVNPIPSTNQNGITGVDLYEATATVAADAVGIPQVTATASDPSVKIEVKQAEARNGTALVKCVYNGVSKTYRIVLR